MRDWLLVALTLFSLPAAAGRPLRLLTEDDPPFNYPDDHGGITGISTEMVTEAFRRAGLSYTMQVMPWLRAYRLAQSDKHACLFSTTRNAEREKQFQWVGPLLKNDWAVFAGPRSPAAIRNMQALRPYRIGGYRGDAVALYLQNRGYKLEYTSDDVLNLRKLMAGHIDFWASGIYHAHDLAKHAHLGPLRKVAVFSTSYLYLACHPQIPPDTLTRLSAALHAMQKDGFVGKLKKRYLDSP
ncbi:substrate-binding periplasmic protein [Chromobacterium paludis]|uniref:ABC transporter substrate-binding protein n=1 Tax=Chromobacterium paludis TaxID=2605945 RepID=A0A5C1DJ96_9NEIS|nr:ABC transporter substrate-binding protein [Chromobacterium paludis]QEL56831.1 ABC transporter substrate-binding protein [Chromobacterium paludis]